jgi:hypothetical protein
MTIRLLAVTSLVVAAALASGCVEERVVHDRPVYVQQPPPREYVEVVAPTPPPPVVVENVRPRPGYIWAHSYYRWDGRGRTFSTTTGGGGVGATTSTYSRGGGGCCT